MKHLHIVAEGRTEEAFIKDVLTPYLATCHVAVHCQLTHTGGTKKFPVKGGLGKVPKYRAIKRALERWIESDRNRPDVYYTTMVDLYAFPRDDESPYTSGLQEDTDKYRKVEGLEKAMEEDLGHERFIAYVQLHEFETFLLIDPDKLSIFFPNQKSQISQLKQEIGQHNVELINDTLQGAPSKRVINYFPDYEAKKREVGPLIAKEIGLGVLREKCDHFNNWITRLENLGKRV